MRKKYIKNLHVKDFRCFKELNVEFNSGFNFIIGPNGCGKTSLLRAIIVSYSNRSMNDSRYGENFEAWIDIKDDTIINRIGVNPDKMRSKLNNEYRDDPSISYWSTPNEDCNNSYLVFDSKKLYFAPLVLGAFRKIDYKKIDGMKREDNIDNSIQQYINNAAMSLNGGVLPNIKQWMINRYFQIDKEWAKEEKENWNWFMENLKILAPINDEFKFKSIERDLEPKFELNNKECYLEELSAGFQSILEIVLSIFEWIEKTNIREEMLVKNATGTVIIDELDVHLHPEWQFTLKKSLETIFPNIQFIVTTHSPHMISTANIKEIIVLDNKSDTMNLFPINRSYDGWNTDQILEEVMGVKTLDNKLYSELIKKGMNCVDSNSISELKDIIEKLEKVAHPSDTIISVFKIKLAALELED